MCPAVMHRHCGVESAKCRRPRGDALLLRVVSVLYFENISYFGKISVKRKACTELRSAKHVPTTPYYGLTITQRRAKNTVAPPHLYGRLIVPDRCTGILHAA
ncbi:unnamed protein product [Sphacelaria rigidula]